MKDSKRRKVKAPGGTLRRTEWKPHLSLPKPKRKKPISKEELVSSHPEHRTTGSGGLPKRKNCFPEEEPVCDPEEAGNRSVPKKKRKFSSKEHSISSGPDQQWT